MTTPLNENQLFPELLWMQKTSTHTETQLTTSPYVNFIGTAGKLWITVKSDDSDCYFSFIVEGGYTPDAPKWNFLQIVETKNCNIFIPFEIIDVDNYKKMTFTENAGVISTVVNSPSHGFTADDAKTSGNSLKFRVVTTDNSRSYRFIFSSIQKNPFRIRKMTGTTFGASTLSITSFWISIPYGVLSNRLSAPLTNWREKIYTITSDKLLNFQRADFYGTCGRQWITVTNPVTGYKFGFIFEGGFDYVRPLWKFEKIVNETGNNNIVIVYKSGHVLNFDIQTEDESRVYNFDISTPFNTNIANTLEEQKRMLIQGEIKEFRNFTFSLVSGTLSNSITVKNFHILVSDI